MALERGVLLADDTLTGTTWCRAHSDLVDAWLAELLVSATGSDTEGVALVAVGGYGRSELAPQSDIDVMLVHDRRADVRALADRVWYPIWDAKLKLGHSVSTIAEALALASDDLDTATALLSARVIAGDETLAERLADQARSQWEKRSKRWLTTLGTRVELRHEKAGEVAFLLEPDLKEGRGGLRDVHSLHWAEAAHRILLDHDADSLTAAYSTLLDARVELQRHSSRPTNVLAFQEQDAVAAALGLANADALMARIAEAARAIAWTSDDTWRRIRSALRGPLGRVNRRTRPLDTGVSLHDGEVHVDHDVSPHDDPVLVLRVALAAARNGTVIDRQSLERLAADAPPMPDPWPTAAGPLFVDLLLSGPSVVPVIEALDQRDVWVRVLPEWEVVRSRPQRSSYHRYTVDRHLLEATANAAAMAGSTERPDLLVTAALVHDLGKGHDGDHTEVGARIAERVTTRMGFPPDDVSTVVALVEQHLLLSDVATRRDIDDVTTIERVAASTGTVARLRLLAALTEADSRATGPAAWTPWKAELVGQLVDRAAHVLEGGELTGMITEHFPTAEQLARLAAGGLTVEGADDVLTVMADDRPGIFSRVAGVIALHGLDVLSAAAHSTDDGRALARFQVADPVRATVPWPRVVADLELALTGRLAVPARLAERARAYGSRRRQTAPPATTAVCFDDDASTNSTVIDVHAPDAVGLLYRITRSLAELDLDIRSAKVQTLGHQVVDAFYVRDAAGDKITDSKVLGEIRRAILHSLPE